MKKEDFKQQKMNIIKMVLFSLSFVLIASSARGLQTKLPDMPNGWSDGYVYANNIRLHYYRAVPATGKPVMVMVHGVTDNGLCWATLALELQDDYDIYMLDTRGHGLSDPFTPVDDGNTLINDVVSFIKVKNFENPILVGHSMGAATVMRLGAEYPDIAKKIIMLDPFLAAPKNRSNRAPGKEPLNKPKKNLSVSMFGTPETLVSQNNYDFEDLVEKGKRDHPKWDALDVEYWALSKKQYHGPYTQEAWEAMSGTMRIGDALSRINKPGLVLKADASPEGRKTNNDVVKDLENIDLVHIDGAGHNLHHDNLKQTVEVIKEFLSTE